MFCKKCGNELVAAADFCQKCGTPVRGVAAPRPTGSGNVAIVVVAVVGGGMLLVVVIGILAAIAIPKFANTKEKAYTAAMRSDLRKLAVAQETYFGEHQEYATATAEGLFAKSGPLLWKPSNGVTIIVDGTAGTTNGWNAQISRGGTTRTCSIYVGAGGTGAFVASGQLEGEPLCY